MEVNTIPQGAQLDLFDGAIPSTPVVATKTQSKEGLRNGHAVVCCGEAAFEYLSRYATERGLVVGPPTKAGKKQRGKLVFLAIVSKQVVRACYAADLAASSRLRRLSAKRFTRLCDAYAVKQKGAKPC